MRLYVLLGVLAIISAITIYDYSVASPATVKANQELETFAVKKIGEGVTREGDKVEVDQFVRSADVQKVLGRAPTVTKTFDNPQGGHVVEYYCYRPWLPVPEISKHYVAVVYWGKDNPRYMSHHINCVPPPDAYPDYRGDGPHGAPPEGGPEAAAGGAGLAPAGTGGGGAPGEPAPPAPFSNRAANELTSPPPGMPGAAKGGKGGKGEKGGKQRPDSEEAKSDEKPAAEKPAEAAPAEEKPTEEKPAEKPAEPAAEEKPAEEKPAEAAPAEEKPAEPAPAEGTEPKPEESK